MMSYKVFSWGRMERFAAAQFPMGHTVYGSATAPPDFISGRGVDKLPCNGYDDYGWQYTDGRIWQDSPVLYQLRDVSVLRTTRGCDRYHIFLEHEIAAIDSYHNGRWIGEQLGETMLLTFGEGAPLRVNIADDVNIQHHVSKPGILVSHLWHDNYAHTLIETASRFWFLFDPFKGYIAADIPFYWDITKPYQRDLVAQIERTSGYSLNIQPLPENHTFFNSLYVPSFYAQIGSSAQAIRFLRDKIHQPPTTPGHRRIYVTRADAQRRRIVNEPELLKLLGGYGFELHALAGQSYSQQRELFGEASIVVAAHGAAMANMLFCGPRTAVIEILCDRYQHFMYQHIAQWCGHWYGRVVSPSRQWDPTVSPTQADIVADVDEVEVAILAALGRA
jgi:hypothetical protein